MPPSPAPDAGPPAAALEPLVRLAVADLAQRLGLDAAAIRVLEARTVVWPDRALGCPRPGMAYPQVPEDGARVVLHAQGRTYAYHSGAGRPPFLCATPG